jgi:hypothetical protein
MDARLGGAFDRLPCHIDIHLFRRPKSSDGGTMYFIGDRLYTLRNRRTGGARFGYSRLDHIDT